MPSHSKTKWRNANNAPRHCVGSLYHDPRGPGRTCLMYRPPSQRPSRRFRDCSRTHPFDNEHPSSTCRRRFDRYRLCGQHDLEDLICPFHGRENRTPSCTVREEPQECRPIVREMPCQTENVRIIVREYRPIGGPCYEEDIFIDDRSEYPAICNPSPCLTSCETQAEPPCLTHSPRVSQPVCPPLVCYEPPCPKISTSCQNIPSLRNTGTVCPRRSVSFSSTLGICHDCNDEDDLPSYPCVPTPYDIFSRKCQTELPRENCCKFESIALEADVQNGSTGDSSRSCSSCESCCTDRETSDNKCRRASSIRNTCERHSVHEIADSGETIERRDSRGRIGNRSSISEGVGCDTGDETASDESYKHHKNKKENNKKKKLLKKDAETNTTSIKESKKSKSKDKLGDEVENKESKKNNKRKERKEKPPPKVECHCYKEEKSPKASKSSSKSSIGSHDGKKSKKQKDKQVESHTPPLAGCECVFPAAYDHLSCFANVFGNCFCKDDQSRK